MDQEFNFGYMKLMQDEEGYGLAMLIRKDNKDVWEVVANFKYVEDFIRYISGHMPRIIERQEQFDMAMRMNQGLTEQFNIVNGTDACKDCGDN